MNSELIEALNAIAKEKRINKEVMFLAIEESLLNACKNHFGKNENFTATVDRNTGDFHVVAAKTVVEKNAWKIIINAAINAMYFFITASWCVFIQRLDS